MDPSCGLAEKFRDIVLDQIWEHLHYLVCYGQNVEQLHERLEELTLERSSIQHRIDEATNNAEQIEGKVLQWLLKVDEISEQVQKLHQESQAKRECTITSCPNPWLRYKLSKRATEMAQQVVEICGKGNFPTVSYRVPPQSIPQLTNRESDKGIGSRVPIMNQIMEALRNPSVNMIGLCGLGGVGKTTIAKEVENNQKMFEKVVMATVSDELDVEKIQGQIAEKLGMQLNERTEDVRASRLRDRLKQEKNMLLILDDLWEELDLGRVGIPFTDVENNSKKNEVCKILLTSRNDTLLSNCMKCQKIVRVGVLSEDEAWELFKRIAELSVDSSSSELIPIATEIVRKCGGLPLAIATAAKALKNRALDEWKYALLRLNNPLRRNITGIKEVDTILKLSYDHLTSSEYKHVFLLAAMLSHDPSIEELLMYSVGLNILQHIENMEDAFLGISRIVSKLKALNLFVDSFSSHHVTIHDVFRDVALSIASDDFCAFIVRHRIVKEWPDENMPEDYKGICLQESDISVELPEELHGPHLQFFMLNSTNPDLTIPSMFFKSSKELKVLAFTNVHFLLLPSLCFLKKLKALCLHSCLLEDITQIRNLKNLKILSLAYSEIRRLPIELAELTSLQMLNLSHCSQLRVIPPKILSSLEKLEVLSMENSFCWWKVEGSGKANENASLIELKDLPISSLDIHIPNVFMLPEDFFFYMNLKRYKIFIGKHWEWQGNYGNSKTLKLELGSSIHLKSGVQKLLEGVEDFTLYGSNVSNEDFKSLFNSKVLLPKIERLELSNINHLIPLIWNEQLSENSFSNLKRLIVESCGFVKLVPLHVLKSLNKFEELQVEECDKLEMVFDFEDLNDYKGMESSSVVVPLKKLKLWRLPKLKNVWSNDPQGTVSFPCLRSVDVYNCESLTSMFPASIAKGMLRHLEDLQIDNCGIDVIVAEDQVSESVNVAFEFPRLTSLWLYKLPNLRNFYPKRHTLKWPNLQQLSIQYCDELEIFEKKVSSSLEIHEDESTVNSKYPLLSYQVLYLNLEELTLQCKQAEMIGSDQFLMYHFPKVKLLHLSIKKITTISYASLLRSFPNLERLQLDGYFEETFGGDDVAALAPRLSTFTLGRISNMISLAPSLVSSPNLTHLQVTSSHELTTLMTSSVARSLVHLTHLSISRCNQIMEIITKHEGEDDEDKKIFFRKLEFLELDKLPRLKRFCGHNYTFKFPFLDQLTITRCPKFKIFSPGVIDTPSLKSVQLSHREIWDTINLNNTIYKQRFVASREVVLDEDDAIMIRNIDQFPADPCSQVKFLCIERIVDEGLTIPYALLERFPHLKALEVTSSQLITLMMSSAARHLIHLTHLSIYDCYQIEKIITTQEGEDDDAQEIIFNKLESLKLEGLPRLKRFCDHNYTFKFPLLKSVNIKECPRLTMFCPGAIYTPLLESVQFCEYKPHSNIWKNDLNTTIQHQFAFEEVISTTRVMVLNVENIRMIKDVFLKVRDLYVESFQDEGVTFPYSSLERFPKLHRLYVEHCSFEGIFPSHDQIVDLEGKVPPFRNLQIAHLDQLKRIWNDDSQLSPIHQNLACLIVKSCCNLVKLVPSSASFQNLEGLNVSGCHQLIHLVTTSAAKSLVSLRWLDIKDCKKMQEIIMNETNEDVQGAITFNQLRKIQLTDMPSLKTFSSQSHNFEFPKLQKIEITGCPEIKMFCQGVLKTPKLSKVKIEGMQWKDEGDLNKTIEMLSSAKDSINT